MPARAGTAYVKIDADFSAFNRDVHAKLSERLTQEVHIKADVSSVSQAESHMRSFSGSTDKAHLSLGHLSTGFRTLYKDAAKITLGGLGVQAISALAAGAVEATAALAPLAGAAAAIPALASAGGQALGVWKLAFNGVTEAVGGLNDQIDKSSKAWKSLTPEGQKFAEQLQKMKAPLRDLSEQAQKGLLPGLETGLKSAMANFDVLKKGVSDTAVVIGDLATQAGKLLGSKAFGQDLDTQMGRNEVTIRRLGDAGLHLFDALVQVTLAAGPLVSWMTKITDSASKQIDAWAQAGRASGQFTAFFKQTRAVMIDVGTIAGNLAVGLVNIFKEAYPSGKSFLDQLTTLSGTFKDWTTSVQGQNSIRDFFNRANPVIKQASLLVGAIARDFGTIGTGQQIAPLLRTIRVDLLPRLYDMVNQTQKAFGKPFLNALGQAVTLFTNLGGTSGALAFSAKVVGGALKAMNALLSVFPGLKSVIATIITVGAIGKIMKIDSAISGMKTLIGLLRSIPGVKIPGIGGSTSSGFSSSSIFSEVTPANPLPVRVMNITGFSGAGASSQIVRTPAQQEMVRRNSAMDPEAVAASRGEPTVLGVPSAATTEEIAQGTAKSWALIGGVAAASFAASLASTVVGQVVGGPAGAKISEIGNNVAMWGGLGATIGTFIEPGIGTAIGGGVGVGLAVIPSLLSKLFGSHKPDFEQMGIMALKHMDEGIKQQGGIDVRALMPDSDVQARRGFEKAAQENIKAYEAQFKRSIAWGHTFAPDPDPKVVADSAKKAVTALTDVVGEQVKQFKIWTPDAFVKSTGLVEAINQLPPKLKPAMAASMVGMARQLVSEGRLPQGSAEKVAREISRRFSIPIAGMGNVADKSLKQISNAFKRSDILNSANAIADRLKRTWFNRDVQGLPLIKGTRSMAVEYAQELSFLAGQAKTQTGKIKKQAETDFKAVQEAAKKSGHGALVGFLTSVDSLAKQGPKVFSHSADLMIDQLHRLPKSSRSTGVAAMVQLTGALQDNGKLPRGATSRLMDKIESEDLSKLPVAARRQAGQAMVDAAAELESKSKLPTNTTAQIVADMDTKWQGLGVTVPKVITGMNANITPPLANTKKQVDQVGASADTTKKKGQQLATEWTSMVQPATKAGTAVRNLGGNFNALKTSVNNSAISITNTTNSVLSGLGADKINFSITKDTKGRQRGGRLEHFGGGWLGGRGMVSADDNILISPYDTAALGEAVVTRHQAPMIEAGMAIANAVTGGQYPFASLDQVFGTITQPHGHQKGGRLGHQAGGYSQMLAKANEIDSHHYPYSYGGGHDANFSAPYDCSGAVSAVLHAGGLLGAPMASAEMSTAFLPGPGLVSVLAHGPDGPTGHAIMRLGGRFFGTSNSNPGGGAGWFPTPDAGYLSAFAVRHVPTTGGTVPRLLWSGGTPMMRTIGQKDSDILVKAANSKISKAIASLGTTGGGDGGDFTGGGMPGKVWEVRVSAEESASGDGWTELSTNGNAAAASGHARTATGSGGWDFATLGRTYPAGTLLNIRSTATGLSGTFPRTDVGDGSSFAPAIGLTPAVQQALGGMPSTADISLADGGSINLASGFGKLVSNTTTGTPAGGERARGGWLRGRQAGGWLRRHQAGGGFHIPSGRWHVPKRSVHQPHQPDPLHIGSIIKHLKRRGKKVIGSHKLTGLLGKIHGLEPPDLTRYSSATSRDEDLSSAAAVLIDTQTLTDAIMSDPVWQAMPSVTGPTGDIRLSSAQQTRQNSIVKNILEQPAYKISGSNGFKPFFNNSVQWLDQELNDLVVWRTHLIKAYTTSQTALKKIRESLTVALKRARALKAEINKRTKERDKYVSERQQLQEKAKLTAAQKHLVTERDQLEKKKNKTKKELKRLDSIKNQLKGVGLTGKEQDRLDWLNDEIPRLNTGGVKDKHDRTLYVGPGLATMNLEDNSLTKDPGGIIPRLQTDRDDWTTAIGLPTDTSGSIYGDLYQVEGAVPENLRFARLTSSQVRGLPMQALFGQIFDVKSRLKDWYGQYQQQPQTSQSETQTDQYQYDLERLEHERQAVQLLQQQFMPSAAGAPLYPFGGNFAAEGQVPGPPGAPRTIIAHGREWVVSNDRMMGGGDTHVIINGKGQALQDLIDVRIEKHSRAQARPAIRQLPGRGGR